jgi:NAD(P)-dependent dehydrogenase (short-subunit alcohol dehydrogenase family)
VREFHGSTAVVEPVVVDVGSASQAVGFVQRAVERFGSLDDIFNIAAILGEFQPIARRAMTFSTR